MRPYQNYVVSTLRSYVFIFFSVESLTLNNIHCVYIYNDVTYACTVILHLL